MAISYPPNSRRATLVNKKNLTLNGSLNATATTLTVNNATGLPTDQTFRLKIDNEVMRCVAVSGNTCTVNRAYDGTTNASHNDASVVEVVLTPNSLESFLLQNSYQGCFTAEGTPIAVPDNKILSQTSNILTTSNFTWLNQGTATATDSGKGGFYIKTQNEAAWNLRGLLLPVPATPYAVFTKLRFGPGYGVGLFGSAFLVGWYQSGTGEIEGLGFRAQESVAFWQFTNTTTFSAVVDSNNSGFGMDDTMWVRFADSGTTQSIRCSRDGNNWSSTGSTFWEKGSTAFLTANYICFLVSSNGSGAAENVFHFDSIVIEEQ